MFFSVYLLFFFPPHNPLISVDEINHSNLSTHILDISIFSSSCLPRNAASFVITLTPLNFIPSSFSKASFIIISLYRLKSKGDITQPCLTPLSTTTSLPTSPSHLTAVCCLQ